jgi:hypothetical protein
VFSGYLERTMEFEVKETLAGYGRDEALKLIELYVTQILLKRPSDTAKECEKQVERICNMVEGWTMRSCLSKGKFI